jgi:cell division protein FtsB
MVNWKERRNPVRVFARRLGMLGLVILVIVAVGAVWGVYKKERESRILRTQAEAELADLRLREERLKEDIEKLQTDRGLEERLRDQYEVAKKGERLLIIVEPATPAPTRATSSVLQWFRDVFPWW